MLHMLVFKRSALLMWTFGWLIFSAFESS